MTPIKPIYRSPAAFSEQANKINELVAAMNALRSLRGEGNITVTLTDTDGIVTDKGSGKSSGLPAGVTFEEFTICDSGSPATRWLATWTSDPS